MTATRQSIAADLKEVSRGRKGKMIVCFEGKPIPPHNPEDTLIVFEEGDEKYL